MNDNHPIELSPAKKFIFSLTAFFLLILILLIINEIIFRMIKGPPNSLFSITQIEKDYLFKPNSVMEKQTSSVPGEFCYTTHINKYGYRGADFSLSKEQDKLRIFAVGDSFTFGVGAEDNETIPYLIEQGLIKKNIKAEVINAGIGHASPITHYVNLRDIHLSYQPDAVLLLLDLTDIQDDWRHEQNAVYDQQGKITHFDPTYINGKRDWWRTLVYYSASFHHLNKKVVRSWQKLRLLGFKHYTQIKKDGERAKGVIATSKDGVFPDNAVLEYDGLLFLRGKEKERLIRQQWQRTAKYIDKIKSLLDEHQIPMILVIYPYGIYVGADQWDEGRKTWGFEANKLYTDHLAFEIVETYAKENNIPFINTLDEFLKAENKKYFFDWDGHMTPDGYKIVAQTILNHPNFQQWLNK